MPSEFKDYTFQFKTIAPNFNITTSDLQSYSKEWQYLLGSLKAADDITIADAKKLVSASQKEKALKIEWDEESAPSRQFAFKIDSINRLIEDSEILVKMETVKAIKADNSGENKVIIPGKNNFTITKMEVVQSPEQYLSINFFGSYKKATKILTD